MKFGLTLITTNVCNFKCKYCYQDKKDTKIMSLGVAKNGVELLLNHHNFNKSITFFGGEPSLNMFLIDKLTKLFNFLTFTVISNGNILTLPLEILQRIHKIVISIECSESAHNFYRNNNYNELLNSIIKFNKKLKNISVNISINKFMLLNYDEFIRHVEVLQAEGIGIHFYMLKSDNGFTPDSLIEFLRKLKANHPNIFNQLVGIYDDNVDTQYGCTLDNTLTLYPNGDFIDCTWSMSKLGDLNTNINDLLYEYSSSIATRHKHKLNPCKDCNINIGYCGISCLPFLIENINTELLENLCLQEKILHLFRVGGIS